MPDDQRDQFVGELPGCGRGDSRTAPTNDRQDQFVDELLEASLKQYRGEEPRPGLEMRILAGVRSRELATRLRGLGWAVAACAGISAAVVLALHFPPTRYRQPSPSTSGDQRAALQAAKPSPMPGSADSRFRSPRLVQGQKPRTPKPGVRATRPARPEQFPTPMPLTEQERLLLAYVARAAKPELVAGANEKNDAAVSDLEIPEIKIAALEIKPLLESESEHEH